MADIIKPPGQEPKVTPSVTSSVPKAPAVTNATSKSWKNIVISLVAGAVIFVSGLLTGLAIPTYNHNSFPHMDDRRSSMITGENNHHNEDTFNQPLENGTPESDIPDEKDERDNEEQVKPSNGTPFNNESNWNAVNKF